MSEPQTQRHSGENKPGGNTIPLFVYVAFLSVLTGLLTFALSKIQPVGGFIFPPGFKFFRALYYLQAGLFAGAICALLLFVTARWRLSIFARAILWIAFYVWFSWQLLWSFVQRFFGIELTPQIVIELFLHPDSIDAVGLTRSEFVSTVAIAIAIIAGLTTLSLFLANIGTSHFRRRVCLAAWALFLALHVPVRAYFVYHINRNNALLLAYDDCAPFPLRTEHLIPGLRSTRLTLPNFESDARTKQYFDHIANLSMPKIPQPQNILWINLESLRFDAISEEVMPHLWAARERFQIRLDQNHWSSGNSTQFGVFSMLTGLSGYHFDKMRRASMNDPFLVLLDRNGYRLRLGKRALMHFGGFDVLFPPSTVAANVANKPLYEGDRRMIDKYLRDREERNGAAPEFDFLPFDATHWPYRFPPNETIFLPVASAKAPSHLAGSDVDLAQSRNAYRNSCHFVDRQIGRVLDDLDARSQFQNSIIIIVGDHGEEFQERGQTAHSAVLNDFQGRTVLWMHLPNIDSVRLPIDRATLHMDIVPTILQSLGFEEDVLYTQGRSLLSKLEPRPMLSLCEQGFTVPLYRALVSDTYISRWWRTPTEYLFSGVERRDGAPVQGNDWANEARDFSAGAAGMYEILPDVSQRPRPFDR